MTTPHPNRPFTIRIYVENGSPAGIRSVEKSNWTGRGVVFPRTEFDRVRNRDEFAKAGVYVLVGPSEETGQERIYVGEGDPVGHRLVAHVSKKEFWTQGYVFVSKDGNLNKAHVQHLEARLLELARTAKQCEIDNATTPERPSLSGPDAAETEGFLEEMLLCLPILGLHVFEQPPVPQRSNVRLRAAGRGAEAHGFEADEGFVVEAGSTAAGDETATTPPYVVALRRRLLDSEVLVPEGGAFRFKHAYTFSSPSTAAAVVLGRNTNGRTKWTDATGKTLRELQEARGT